MALGRTVVQVFVKQTNPAAALLARLSVIILLAGFRADTQAVSDYQVKAAYLFNFAKFVQWPEQQSGGSANPVRFCIYRDRLFEAELTRIVKGKTIAGRAIEVSQVDNGEQSQNCSALFVNSSQQRQSRQLLDALHGSSVLTVGETEEFLRDGGMIAFVLEQDRIQFVINHKAATEARLYISSKMLTLARRVVD